MGQPSATEALLRFEDHEAGARTLLLQVVSAANTGDPGADNEHIEMLGTRRSDRFQVCWFVHWIRPTGGLALHGEFTGNRYRQTVLSDGRVLTNFLFD